MASFEEFHLVLVGHLGSVLGRDFTGASPNLDLLEILDSLSLIQVLFALEKDLGVEFPFERLTPEMVQNSRRIYAVLESAPGA